MTRFSPALAHQRPEQTCSNRAATAPGQNRTQPEFKPLRSPKLGYLSYPLGRTRTHPQSPQRLCTAEGEGSNPIGSTQKCADLQVKRKTTTALDVRGSPCAATRVANLKVRENRPCANFAISPGLCKPGKRRERHLTALHGGGQGARNVFARAGCLPNRLTDAALVIPFVAGVPSLKDPRHTFGAAAYSSSESNMYCQAKGLG
jgi:hypothetical protein